jgi:hypothetical protein
MPCNIFRARSAFLYSVLTLSYGSITNSVIGSVCYGSNGGQFLAHTVELLPDPLTFVGSSEEHHIIMSSDKIEHLSFHLTPAASTEQRARAYAFDERFLGRFSACNDATDMH